MPPPLSGPRQVTAAAASHLLSPLLLTPLPGRRREREREVGLALARLLFLPPDTYARFSVIFGVLFARVRARAWKVSGSAVVS